MRRLLLAAVLLSSAACAEEDPAITPQQERTESPIPAGTEFTVTAVEYEFQGMPESLSEGEYTFTLENAGKEKHELYLFFISGEQTIEELSKLPPRKLSRVTQAVDSAIAPPDLSDSFRAGLVPGRFGYECLVPAPDGTLHAALGMRGEFTVT